MFVYTKEDVTTLIYAILFTFAKHALLIVLSVTNLEWMGAFLVLYLRKKACSSVS